jgi:CheY-like chemotaxis protein
MEHPGLRGLSILVVENELLIAMDIAKALEGAGANATLTTTARHAMILADHDGLAAPSWTTDLRTATAPLFARD